MDSLCTEVVGNNEYLRFVVEPGSSAMDFKPYT